MNKEQRTEEVLRELFIALSRALGAFAVLGVSILCEGGTLSYLWNGIMTSVFGLTSLSAIQSMGLVVIINFVTYRGNAENKKTLLQTFLYVLFVNLIFQFMGWLVMLFI